MKVLNLPLTKNLHIQTTEKGTYLLEMVHHPNLLNHLETIHGSASYALAEISSGHFLNTRFRDIADQTVPILRESRVKYRLAGEGNLYSKVAMVGITEEEVRKKLLARKKIILTLQVRLYNEENKLVLSAEFDWFITLAR